MKKTSQVIFPPVATPGGGRESSDAPLARAPVFLLENDGVEYGKKNKTGVLSFGGLPRRSGCIFEVSFPEGRAF